MQEPITSLSSPVDEPEKPLPFLCRIGWHAWTAWSDPRYGTEGPLGFHYIEQSRRCTHCNTVQQRRRDENGCEIFW